MDKKNIIIISIAFILSCLLLVLSSNSNQLPSKILGINIETKSPKQLYRVYLSGESIGVIESKEELEKYIDEKQQEIKDAYSVSKVYAPNDLDIMKEITYNEKISTVEEINEKIEEIKGSSSFTIDGYTIKIEGIEKKDEQGNVIEAKDVILYVIDKDIFTNSVEKTITAFVDKEVYNAYINGTQKQLEENKVGMVLEDLTIQNKITIQKGHIPTGEKIYTSEEELSQLLLFGTNREQETYTVKAGDTIETIADDNKLSTEEFLIANSNFSTAQDLLYPGQVVKLGLIKPQFDLVETRQVTSEEVIKKETVYKDDSSQFVGYEKVEEEGQDGLALKTQVITLTNGEITDNISVGEDIVLRPAVNKVIVRGTKRKPQGGSINPNYDVPVEIGSWVWPTNSPYIITSNFGWRWGKYHDGLDISGTGYGSPIKAANNGLIVTSDYTDTNGNFIIIAHSNGYYTIYGHMAARYKQPGDIVMAGDIIGSMGETGYAFGVHLHFGLSNGPCWGNGSTWLNPLTTIYR